MKPRYRTFREQAVRMAKKEIGVHEIGFTNRGKKVDEYQRADGLPGVGYSWCMSFIQWCFKQAGKPLPFKTASVGLFQNWARQHGMIVQRPLRGDIVCYQFDADNWPDHTGIVERVIGIRPLWVIRTIEGNTSDGIGGSQADGGEVARRIRRVRKSRVAFVRVPGRYKVIEL